MKTFLGISPQSSNSGYNDDSMEIFIPIKLKNGPWTGRSNTPWKINGKGTKQFSGNSLSFTSDKKSTFLTSGHSVTAVHLLQTGKNQFTLSYSYRQRGLFKDKATYSFSDCKFKYKAIDYQNGVPVFPYNTDYLNWP